MSAQLYLAVLLMPDGALAVAGIPGQDAAARLTKIINAAELLSKVLACEFAGMPPGEPLADLEGAARLLASACEAVHKDAVRRDDPDAANVKGGVA